jgi:hypothetical protein
MDTLQARKKTTDTVITPFTDHSAVVVKTTYPYDTIPLRMRRWTMKASLLDDRVFQTTLKNLWTSWTMSKEYYPTELLWWERYIKRRIKTNFIRENAAKNKENKDMEEFYYATIDQAMKSNGNPTSRAIAIRHLKAKLLKVLNKQRRNILLDTAEHDLIEGEGITTHQYISVKKRQ